MLSMLQFAFFSAGDGVAVSVGVGVGVAVAVADAAVAAAADVGVVEVGCAAVGVVAADAVCELVEMSKSLALFCNGRLKERRKQNNYSLC